LLELVCQTGLLRRQAYRAGVLLRATGEHDATGQRKKNLSRRGHSKQPHGRAPEGVSFVLEYWAGQDMFEEGCNRFTLSMTAMATMTKRTRKGNTLRSWSWITEPRQTSTCFWLLCEMGDARLGRNWTGWGERFGRRELACLSCSLVSDIWGGWMQKGTLRAPNVAVSNPGR
jgi:hypothetical protein